MPSSVASSASAVTLWRRFRRNRGGSAAVEFALVAPIFFALLFAILEVAMMFFASQVLETITQESARIILTGQAQSGGVTACQVGGQASPCTQSSFRSYVCSQIPALFSCANVLIDVENYAAFSNISISSPTDCSSNFTPSTGYNPGNPGDIVVVRLFYSWPLFVTGFGFNMCNMSGNQRMLVATAAFQNEPY